MPLVASLHLATLSACIFLITTTAQAQVAKPDEASEDQIAAMLERLEIADDIIYVVRLNNGDMLSGSLSEISKDEGGDYIRIAASIGRAKIYLKEIASIETNRDFDGELPPEAMSKASVKPFLKLVE